MKAIKKVELELLPEGQQEFTVWFHDSDEPFTRDEFDQGSQTWEALSDLNCAITDIIEIVNVFAEKER